jgi:hypothetical protein
MTGSNVKARHAVNERGNDLYETPPEAVAAIVPLLADLYGPEPASVIDEGGPWTFWEPCCGPGSIVQVLAGAGLPVVASDLVDYSDRWRAGPGVVPHWRRDVLLERAPPAGLNAAQTIVVTNPPYKNAPEIIRHLRDVVGVREQWHLLRLPFLEGTTRPDLIEPGSGLRRVIVASRRLPMMHRDGWEGPISGSATAYAWFNWVRPDAWRGPAEMTRFDWKAAA